MASSEVGPSHWSEELGLNDGQELVIQVRPVATTGTRGEGLRRSAGALAADPEWDGIMEEVAEGVVRHRRVDSPCPPVQSDSQAVRYRLEEEGP